MARTRRKFDEDFKAGAVRIVRETGKPIAQVAREHACCFGTKRSTYSSYRPSSKAVGSGPPKP